MLYFEKNQFNLGEKSCSQEIENKRLCDIYSSFIFKGKSPCISYWYKMLIGVLEDSAQSLGFRCVSKIFCLYCLPLVLHLSHGMGKLSSGWRLRKRYPPVSPCQGPWDCSPSPFQGSPCSLHWAVASACPPWFLPFASYCLLDSSTLFPVHRTKSTWDPTASMLFKPWLTTVEVIVVTFR